MFDFCDIDVKDITFSLGLSGVQRATGCHVRIAPNGFHSLQQKSARDTIYTIHGMKCVGACMDAVHVAVRPDLAP